MTKEKLLNNAWQARVAMDKWNECSKYPTGVPYFHLRPTTGGITLVTTHPSKAMRGISKIAISRCIEMLDLAANSVNDNSLKWESIKYTPKSNNDRTFPERSESSLASKKEKEFLIQAWLINEIVNENKALNEKFNNVPNLFFLGSEIIWQEENQKGGKRIDIVAHDGKGKVLFIELKDKSSKDEPSEQVSGYIKTYDCDEFKEFLKCYPSLPPIKKIDSFEGWVVIGDHKDIDKDRFIENLCVRRV